MVPLQGRSFWESSPPMGPPENPTAHPENQEGRRRRLPCRPRTRRCLLKGCERAFIPGGCASATAARNAGRRHGNGRDGKPKKRYRETEAGQQKRNGQSRRYRERVKNRKPPEPEAVNDSARVITTEHFFRSLLRPARLLRELPAPAAKSFTALLFAHLQARARARPGAGKALETGARLNP